MPRYPAQPLEEKFAWMREKQRKREPEGSPQSPQLPQYHRMKQVARALGISDRTARRWFRKRAVIVSGPCGTKSTMLIPQQAVDDFIRKHGPSVVSNK
ncbi:MAG: helix-turn-helix domain-containing protein [Bryobacteraceae bacterium]